MMNEMKMISFEIPKQSFILANTNFQQSEKIQKYFNPPKISWIYKYKASLRCSYGCRLVQMY